MQKALFFVRTSSQRIEWLLLLRRTASDARAPRSPTAAFSAMSNHVADAARHSQRFIFTYRARAVLTKLCAMNAFF